MLVLSLVLWWAFIQDSVQTQITPSRFLLTLSGSLDAEGGVLLWDHIVFIIWVKRLVLRWHIDLFMR